MITATQALAIVKRHNPKMKVITCFEQSDYYEFGLIPEDFRPGDGFANSCVHLVEKATGKYKTAHFMDMSSDYLRKIEVIE